MHNDNFGIKNGFTKYPKESNVLNNISHSNIFLTLLLCPGFHQTIKLLLATGSIERLSHVARRLKQNTAHANTEYQYIP